MPVLSLPIPLPGAAGGPMWLPLRIPFPIMRIGSILPSSLNEPFKNSLLALFKLAWSNKVQLPVLITVCFMAFDIRMQLEINFFWENPRPNVTRQRRNVRGSRSNVNNEALRAAIITSALLQRQRQRIELQETARQQELTSALNGGRHNYPAVNVEVTDDEDDDTDTAEDQVATLEGQGEKSGMKRKRKCRTGGPSEEEEEDTEDDEDSEEEDNDEDDDDSNDDDDDDGASQNPGFLGESDGDHDYFSEDHSNGGERSDEDEDSNEGGTPLVVQLEIHQRSTFNELKNRLCYAIDSLSLSSFDFISSLKHTIVPLRNTMES